MGALAALGFTSQGSLSQVTFLGRLQCPWADASIARAEPGHVSYSSSEAEDQLGHASFCSAVNISRGCLSQLSQEVGLGAGFGAGTEQR